MKVTREKAAQNHDHILDTAAKLFRERGFDGIGVSDLMKSAGLTHGGFYGHFSSKEDLIAQACARTQAGSEARWRELSEHSDEPFKAYVKSYLSAAHRDDPGGGCPISSLGPEIARQGRPVREVVTETLRSYLQSLTRLIPGRSEKKRRRKAIAGLCKPRRRSDFGARRERCGAFRGNIASGVG